MFTKITLFFCIVSFIGLTLPLAVQSANNNFDSGSQAIMQKVAYLPGLGFYRYNFYPREGLNFYGYPYYYYSYNDAPGDLGIPYPGIRPRIPQYGGFSAYGSGTWG